MRAKLLLVTCLIVIGITLTLGLWPFHAPKNAVTWIRGANGLSFNRYGSALSGSSFRAAGSDTFARQSAQAAGRGTKQMRNAADLAATRESVVRVFLKSVEVWIRGAGPFHNCTLLSFYNPQQSLQLSMRQSFADFVLRADTRTPEGKPKRVTLTVNNVFRRREPMFLAFTSGPNGTAVYINGLLAKELAGYPIAREDFQGRFILGDAPLHPDGWIGDVRGVALYDSELSGAQIRAHWDTWKQTGRPKVTGDERLAALYLLDEHGGRLVHDISGSGHDLVIPETYGVLDKVVLEPIWKEFEMTRSYGTAALKNIVGFVPFGFCFYLFLIECRRRRPALLTIWAGFLISLLIEVLQIYLPTRDSGTTDFVTNTVGTALGVLTCRLLRPFDSLHRLTAVANFGSAGRGISLGLTQGKNSGDEQEQVYREK